jgi:hypothetical protein
MCRCDASCAVHAVAVNNRVRRCVIGEAGQPRPAESTSKEKAWTAYLSATLSIRISFATPGAAMASVAGAIKPSACLNRGANGEGRTPMPLRALEPKSSASANSATFARGR